MDNEIRKRILEEAIIEKSFHLNTLGEEELRVTMKLLNCEVTSYFKVTDIENLQNKWGMDVEYFAQNLLINEMVNKGIVEKFIKLERRDKNLNILTDDEDII